MTPSEFGLHRVSNAELQRLLRALHRGALRAPITRSDLIEKAFGHVEAHLDLLIGRDLAAAKALVVAVLSERASDGAGASQRASASLVYMGPPAPATRSRDTFEQVRELLASATKSAHLYGLELHDDRGVLRTVAALMAGRDARVRLVFASDGDPDAITRAQGLLKPRFTGTSALLEAFVCVGARLRARSVVIDGERVLLTSSSLSGSEEDGCIDLGASISSRELALAIEDEWTKLLTLGILQRVDLT